jgi:CSLREA domain-containing protein
MKLVVRIFLIALVTFCFSLAASAATFVVNTTADTPDIAIGDGNCVDASGNCSLRAAISETNALAGADIITLPAGTYTQTLVAADEDINAGGDWDIFGALTINGAGQDTTILQAAATPGTATERVLENIGTSNSLTINGVTIRHGFKQSGGSSPNFGGGIRNRGNLHLNDSTVTLNTASDGGGIRSETFLFLSGVTVTNNACVTTTVICFGGGIHTFAPSTGGGGGSIHNSVISNNSATATGTNAVALGAGMMADGIGSYLLEIFDSHFDGNKGIGTGFGSGQGNGLRINAGNSHATANISNTTFNGNSTPAARAGGLSVFSGGAGGIDGAWDGLTISGNNVSEGGGLEVTGAGGAIDINMLNSTISGNSASTKGGGIYVSDLNQGPAVSSITLNMVNDTVSGNSAAGSGGGVMIDQFLSTGTPRIMMNFCTIAGNRANSDNTGTDVGGGLALSPAFGAMSIKNTIVADNTVGSPGGGPDLFGPVASQDFNHVENAGSFVTMPHDTTGFDPQLGPLQNNGGPTLTHLLTAGSPLLDTIPSGTNDCGTLVPNDQRSFIRPLNGSCDKGSTEGAGLAPGPWSLSGVIKTTTGQPIRNAAVRISGGNLPAPITVFTGNLGTYQFTNLPGSEYTVDVSIKRYHFINASQVFSLGQDITDADFIANAPFSRLQPGQNPKR